MIYHKSRRAALLVPALERGDAVGEDLLAQAALLESLNYDVRIFAEKWRYSGNVQHQSEIERYITQKDDLLIYHYCVHWPRAKQILTNCGGKKILRYHNVTPGHFFAPYHKGIAENCNAGREALSDFILPGIDLYLSCSNYSQGELLAAGAAPKHLEVLPPLQERSSLLNCDADLMALRLTSSPHPRRGYSTGPTFLVVGRIAPNKNHRFLLEALASFCQRYTPLTGEPLMLFVGTPLPEIKAYQRELKREAKRLGVARNILFTGKVRPPILRSAYLSATALLSATLHEGFCRPPVEAMALGVPVIALDHAAVGETIGKGGVVLPGNASADQMADEMARLAIHPQAALAVAAEGRRHYRQNFRSSQLERRFIELIEKAQRPRTRKKATTTPSTLHDIAIVVQRSHPNVTGGAELHAAQLARLLKRYGKVELLTTTALDSNTWRNELEAGESHSDGLTVRRFEVERERSAYWYGLDQILNSWPEHEPIHWPAGLQLEWLRRQGPDSPDLYDYLATAAHKKVIFFSYMYPTTFLAQENIAREKSYLVPTLHDEPAAYLPATSYLLGQFKRILWNSNEESYLATRLLAGRSPLPEGSLVGLPIERDSSRQLTRDRRRSHFLFCGRLDSGKGIAEMISAWRIFVREFKRQRKRRKHSDTAPPALVLIGGQFDHSREGERLREEVDLDPTIRHIGRVSEKQKWQLMRHAIALLQPSRRESLSLVTLEAIGHGTPVLAPEESLVVREHILRSGCGLLYRDRNDFVAQLLRLSNEDDRSAGKDLLRRAGLNYIDQNYSEEVVVERLASALNLRERRAVDS